MPARSGISAAKVSALLYMLSLALPALVVMQRPLFGGGGHEEAMFGLQCLVLGFAVPPPWLANHLLLFAAIALAWRRPVTARVAAVIAIGLGFSTLDFIRDDIVSVHIGFFVWIASMVAMLVATFREPIVAPSSL